MQPGRAAFPFHHQYGNEEHFFVLSGTGQLRYYIAQNETKGEVSYWDGEDGKAVAGVLTADS